LQNFVAESLPPTPTLIASNKLLKNVFLSLTLFEQGGVFYIVPLDCQSIFLTFFKTVNRKISPLFSILSAS